MKRLVFLISIILSQAAPAMAQVDAVPQSITIPSLDPVTQQTDQTVPGADTVIRRQAPEGTVRIDEGTSVDSLWVAANGAYTSSDYAHAANLYSAILQKGLRSAKLYYNLGNAYYQQSQMGRAILNYNRALLLDPSDEYTRHNLAMANARIVDKIDTVPEFIVKTWVRNLALSLGSNTWAVLGLLCLALTFGGIVLWLLSHKLGLRKSGFYGALVFGLCFLLSTYFASYQRGRLIRNTEAIVMNMVAPVKSSPAEGSTDLFGLHEGTKVRVIERLDGWAEIVISDGNRGWIHESAIEYLVEQ